MMCFRVILKVSSQCDSDVMALLQRDEHFRKYHIYNHKRFTLLAIGKHVQPATPNQGLYRPDG